MSSTFGIQPQILRRAAAGNHQGVVVRCIHLIECRVEGEVVSALLGVGLVAFKVVDGGAYLVALLLAGANRVHAVAHHLQRLKRNHDLVVFNEIAGQQQ
jgi:hypothetical protein